MFVVWTGCPLTTILATFVTSPPALVVVDEDADDSYVFETG